MSLCARVACTNFGSHEWLICLQIRFPVLLLELREICSGVLAGAEPPEQPRQDGRMHPFSVLWDDENVLGITELLQRAESCVLPSRCPFSICFRFPEKLA